MIASGGETLYCVQVESVLTGAAGVLGVGVAAVADPVMGGDVGVVVVPAPGHGLDPTAFVEDPPQTSQTPMSPGTGRFGPALGAAPGVASSRMCQMDRLQVPR